MIIWTSLWSNAFQAALHGQEARWDLLFALPVIDLMSVEPERTSELKVRNSFWNTCLHRNLGFRVWVWGLGLRISAQESMTDGFRVYG